MENGLRESLGVSYTSGVLKVEKRSTHYFQNFGQERTRGRREGRGGKKRREETPVVSEEY